MRKLLGWGSRRLLLLSRQELYDVAEALRLYCVGDTREEAEVEPEIRSTYPDHRFTAPAEERFWRLHAEMETAKGGGAQKATGSD